MGYQNEPTGSNEVRELFTPILHVATNVFPIKYSDGSWGEGKQLGYNIVANVSTRGQELNKSFQGWYDFSLEQKLDFITKGLSAKGKLAYNSYADTNTRIRAGQILVPIILSPSLLFSVHIVAIIQIYCKSGWFYIISDDR